MTRARRDLALFAGALLVRGAHLLVTRSGPLFRYRLIDSEWYDEVGRRIAAGEGFPDGVFFMNVLYGAFLGAVYSVFGPGDPGRLAALAVQVASGAASTVLLARLGDAFGRPRAGLLAAATLAVFGPAIFYDSALLTPSLLLFLTTGALLVAARNPEGRPLAAFGLGVIGGLLVLGRANNALLIPVFAVPWLRRGRSGIAPTALLLAGAIAVVAPVTARNWRESGELVPVTANGGMALWAGNHPGATGIYSMPAFLENPIPEREAEDYRREASRRAGRELGLPESGRFWVAETGRRWLEEPGASLALLGRKIRYFFHATESQTNLSYYFARDHSPILQIFRVHFGWILPFALIGLGTDGRRLPLPAAAIGVSLLTCLVFYVSSEYRHPVVPAFLLFAAVGAIRLADLVRRARPPARVTIGLAFLALVVAVNFRDPFLARLQSRRVDYLNFGTLAFAADEMGDAERFLRRSLAIDPAFEPARRKLIDVLARTGRPAEAAREARRLPASDVAATPAEAAALEAASRSFRERRYEEAKEAFLRIAGTRSDARASCLNNAGLCAMNLGSPAEADSLFRIAQVESPGYASPVIHRGRLALVLGDSTAAIARAREALALAPDDERARRLLRRATGEAEPEPEPEPGPVEPGP